MDTRRFDLIARALATDGSRRQLLGRLAGSAVGSLFAVGGVGSATAQDDDEGEEEDDGGNAGAGNARQGQECRGDGRPCEGNQQCCDGLVCAQGEPGAAFRCAAQSDPATCEGDCPQQVTVEEVPSDEAEEAEEPAVGQRARCRAAGDECGPDAICCDGLPCEAGKDGGARCAGDEPVETCAETCAPTEVKVRKPRSYTVETDCRYDDADDRTTCDCLARSDDDQAPKVKRVTLSQADVCAEVVAGEFSVGSGGTNTASAGNGGNANASADGGQVVVGDNASGGAASANAAGGSGNVAIAGSRGVRYLSLPDRDTLRLTFDGRVEAAGTATYWCETDTGLVPALGPALGRAPDDLSGDSGSIVVRALSCDVADAPDDFDWYGQCRRPAKARLRLRALQGGKTEEKGNAETDNAGRRSFRQLAAGTYRIAPEGDKWCHAECNSVDDNGDVVLQAGQRATVYVFHCGKA